MRRTPQPPAKPPAGCARRVTGTLHCDSRKVGAGDGFIAWPGAATDGRKHVHAALAQGAAACLVEREGVRGVRLRHSEPSRPTPGSRRRPARSPPPILRCADRAARRAGRHRHQRQDLDRLVAGPGPVRPGAGAMPCGLVGTLGIGRPPACRVHRTHHARPGAAAAPVPPLPGRRRQGLRDRSLVDRHRRAAAGRHADSRGGLHQFHPGPPGLPRHAWRPTGRPRPNCSAGRACGQRWSTSTTRRGGQLVAVAARRRARPVDGLLRGSRRG